VQQFLPELKRPKLVVAYAFDILPPQARSSQRARNRIAF
jgi:hypothetical protein